MILETERLCLRKLTPADRAALCETLQDKEAMYAYEHAFSDEEADAWLARQIARYQEDGFGLWAVIRKEDGAFLGQCGITMQDVHGERVPEIGYLLAHRYWHMGYATEAARACKQYAFETLGLLRITGLVDAPNTASRKVLEKNGFVLEGIMKNAVTKDGKIYDLCIYGKLRKALP